MLEWLKRYKVRIVQEVRYADPRFTTLSHTSLDCGTRAEALKLASWAANLSSCVSATVEDKLRPRNVVWMPGPLAASAKTQWDGNGYKVNLHDTPYQMDERG